MTEFDFDTYYLLWEYYDSLIGIGIGMKKRIQEMKTAAATGRSTRIQDDYDYPVTWDRLRNRKSKQKMYQITQRPPSYSSYLKSTSVQLYKARLMLAHSICFWGPCREQFQTIRQLADHVAAAHLKPLFDKGTIENIPCCWRHCVMVFKNTRSLLTHVAESHIGNEDLMDFQVCFY